MFIFSVSSFIDLLNSLACFILVLRLRKSYQKNPSQLIKSFSLFYLFFGIFFLFLGIPFFIPNNPTIIQTSFVFAHLFLYFAIASFLLWFLKLINKPNWSYFFTWLITGIGILIFILSINEGSSARLFTLELGTLKVISWSHGGNSWIRLLIGAGGTLLGAIVGIFFLFYSSEHIKEEVVARKGRFIGFGFVFLGLAAFLAFILSVFDFYNFWIVLTAELATISGLFFIYNAISLGIVKKNIK